MTGIIHTYTVHSKGTVRAVNTSVLAVPHTSHGFHGFSSPTRPLSLDRTLLPPRMGWRVWWAQEGTSGNPPVPLIVTLPPHSPLGSLPCIYLFVLAGMALEEGRPVPTDHGIAGTLKRPPRLGQGPLEARPPECGRLTLRLYCICLCGGRGWHNIGEAQH